MVWCHLKCPEKANMQDKVNLVIVWDAEQEDMEEQGLSKDAEENLLWKCDL